LLRIFQISNAVSDIFALLKEMSTDFWGRFCIFPSKYGILLAAAIVARVLFSLGKNLAGNSFCWLGRDSMAFS
jgi:hypothetical protein